MGVEVVDFLMRAKMETSEAVSGISQIQKALQGLTLPKGLSNDLEKEFSKLGPLLKDYQKQLNKGFSNKKDLQNFNALRQQIGDTFGNIKTLVSQANSQEIRLKVDTQSIDQLQNKIASKTEALNKAFSQVFTKTANPANITEQLNKVLNSTLKASSIKGMVGNAQGLFNSRDYVAYNTEIDKIKNKILSLKTTKMDFAQALGIKDAEKDIAGVEQKITNFFNKLKINDSKAQGIELLKKELQELGMQAEGLDLSSKIKGEDEIRNIGSALDQVQQNFHETGNAADEAASGILSMKDQVGQLQQSTQYFFSLRNMINLFKRGVEDAVQSVKELDKAMTETAVVTDYKVSDLWGMLPQYTQLANQLGATTQGAYETMTLYFQQGLDEQAAFEVGAETMKMARIAGLDYAETTDMMTAALRGFNMELNETSAKRVNDVYSELAAITASDTEELGTAMQRTASIAHSAGASFEGTTAFLAQAIETTREPAENIGTAMKTIIARFQEMKKNPLEISEVEGEEVDYNKIDAALKTIGVSLKTTSGQFRDFDEVMLDISARWDGLSQSQQRYIATTAAGSRQQSRFIAMVSNYGRTMQLMEAANNSAGASDEQFGKTMDSLESKLNKLHNAWQAFTMGIANNTFVKGAVDGLTLFLDKTNKIIDTLSGGSQVVKSFLSLFAAFTGLKAVGRFANAAIGGLGGMLDPQKSFKQGFFSGAFGNKQSNNIAQARMISDPIVNAINRLYQAQTGKTVTKDSQTNATADYKAFKEANTGLRGYLSQLKAGEEFSLGTAYQKISKMDDKQQKAILQQLPGLSMSLETSGIKLNTKGLSKSSKDLLNVFSEEVNNGLKNKTLDSQAVLKMFGTPDDFRKAMSLHGEEYGTAAEEVLLRGFNEQDFRKKLLDDYYKNDQNQDLTPDQLESYLKGEVAKEKERVSKSNIEDLATSTQAHGAAIANAFGKVGTSAIMAGQGVAQLGMQLTQLGMTNVGGIITDLGYKISSLGMIASSVGSILGQVAKAGAGSFGAGMLSIVQAHPIIVTLSAITVAATAVITIFHNMKKAAKEAAEEIQKKYSETIKDTDEKISALESNKDIFNELSKGVDKYGHNISLTAEEYEQYLDISKTLAETSPSLIKGYDAQGRAIIANGKAIDELISKQKDLQDSAKKNYTNAGAIDTTIEGIRAGDSIKLAANYNEITKADLAGKSGTYNLPFFNKQVKTLERSLKKLDSKQVAKLNTEISKLTGQKIDLNNLTKDGVKTLATNYSDINRIVEENGQKLNDTTRENLEKAFTDLGEDYSTFVGDLEPLTNQLSTYLDAKGMSAAGLGISDEFIGGFNKGLENLAMDATLENWGGARLQREAENYAAQFKKLTNENSAYSRTLEQVDRAQQNYLEHVGEPGAIDDYNSSIQNQISTLNQLANQYENSGAAGEAFAEMCRQAAADAQHFTEYGVASLAEGLNSLSSEFSYARGAEERFKEATKGGDYYTAAEQYKSIIDTVMDEKNNAGQGSLTAWRGATELLGTNFVDSADDWSSVANQIKRITPMFEDGADGVLAFNDYLVEAWETAGNGGKVLSKLGDVVQGEFGKDFKFNFENVNDHLKEFSEELGISEGALAALIDKSRQWVPWDISDPGMIMSALRTSDTSMEGKGGKLYTSESAFREEAYAHEIVGDNYKTTKGNLEREQNVDFLTVDKLVSKGDNGQAYANEVLKDIGISSAQQNNTLDNAVQAYTKMGFGLEDIQKILTSDGVSLQEGKVTDAQVEEAYNEQEFAQENPTVAGIANDTGLIASNTSAMAVAMGILGKDTKQEAEKLGDRKYAGELYENFKTEFEGSKTGAEKEAAYNKARGVVDNYDATIEQFKRGQGSHEEGSAAWKEYQGIIDNLQKARDSYSKLIDYDYNKYKEQTELAKESLESISTRPEDQSFLESEALNVSEILQSSDLSGAIGQLQQLQAEGNLTYGTMHGLVEALIQTGNVDLSNLTYGEVAGLLGQIIPVESEAQKLAALMMGLSDEQINILFNSEVRGAEQVNEFLTSLNKEFGDNTVKTQKVLVDAQLEVAKGNSKEASELLKEELGLDEKTAETVTKKMEVAVETDVIGETDLQAVKDSITDLPDNQDVQVTVNYVKNSQDPPEPQEAGLKYNKTGQDPPDKKEAGLKYNKTGQDDPDKKNADLYYNKTGQDAPSPDSAGVKYYISYQEPPSTMHASVIYDKKYKGQNNRGIAHSGVSIRSAASGLNNENFAGTSIGGKRGQRKQIALTGEKGFEIAWIPSEQRAVILGEKGPEVANFPSDTVIYTNEQSKKILKGNPNRKSFDSFASGRSAGIRSSTLKYTGGSGGGSGKGSGSGKSSGKSSGGSGGGDGDKKVSKLAGKISVWWENQVRKVDAYTRKMDTNADNFAKILKKGGGTLKSAQSAIKAYKNSIDQTIKINKTSLKQANKELKNLDTKKSNYAISYKTGKGSKTKNDTVNLAKYIKYDKASGTYVIDQNAINKVASKNKYQAKAIKEVAEKTLNEKLGRKKTAEDNIKKAQDALDKLNDEVYQTFYSWEKSINRVYVLSQKLEKLEKKASIYDAKEGVVYSELEAGEGQNSNVSKAVFNLKYNAARERNNMVNTIETSRLAMGAARSEFNAAKDIETYRKIYNKNKGSASALVDWKGAQEAIKLFNKYNGDYDKAITELNGKNYNETTYNKIKEILDKIHEKETALLDATEAAYKSIQDLYDRIEEDQQTIADFENELLDAIIDQAEKRIDQVEKLNSALTNQFKRLIDEVKRNLDERRKKEDNQKTEDDLAKKQQRLASLRADTSGGNALEIARLEQEIFEGRQGYQRTLEDQLLDKLTQQGDKAADQRERQISLLHGQHEIAKKTGKYVEQVATWMSDPNAYMSQIKNVWLTQKGYDEATNTNRQQLDQNFNKTIVQVQVAMADLKASIDKLKETGANGDENYADIQAGLTAKEIKTLVNEKGEHLFEASVFKNAGYKIETLKDSGIYTDKELFNAGYSKEDLSKVGIKIEDLVKAGITAPQLQKRGYGLKETSKATGGTLEDMVKAGFTAKDFKADKYDAKTAAKAGVKTADIANVYGAADAAKIYGIAAMQASDKVTGVDVQNAKGTSAKALQQAVNKSSKDKATQKDMAGVQVGKVDVNGKKKGGAVKDSHISSKGTTVGANKGSTLYTADWDEKTGKVKGKWTAYTIDKLTADLIKRYPTDGRQALVYAIQHTKIGSKINQNMSGLVKAAGIVGKTYKLANGTTASIGSGGGIHYNGTKNKKDGVYIWNPAAGKLSFREYKKNDFIKWAKDKNTGREYAAVLKKKKVKGYATGGLADFTGPAWLDGTKSKPELVLNSTDTKNFIALRDVLNQALRSTSSINNSYGGDATYEININVDHINSDYDVDKIAERVKRNIVKDSSYRNVTQVRKFR